MNKKKSVPAETDRNGATARKRPSATKRKDKLTRLEAMLRRSDIATIDRISKSLAWQAHSLAGVMAGALGKKQSPTITSVKTYDSGLRRQQCDRSTSCVAVAIDCRHLIHGPSLPVSTASIE
jgi:hypothetical protein